MLPSFVFALSPSLLAMVVIVLSVLAVAVLVEIGGRCGFSRTSGEVHSVVTHCTCYVSSRLC